MSVLAAVRVLAEGAGEHGAHTPNSWLPESYEIIWGGLATLVIAFALWKFAIPQLRKALTDRTARIQRDLDSSAAALADAEQVAARTRASKGDLEAERSRLLAEADTTAQRVLADGRARIDQEVADARTRATADLGLARQRVTDELQADVVRLAGTATEDVVAGSLDDAAQQRLIEDFIAKVGASQ